MVPLLSRSAPSASTSGMASSTTSRTNSHTNSFTHQPGMRGRGGVAAAAALGVLGVHAVGATEYSTPNLNNSYVSETVLNDRGMGMLYDAAVKFLRSIQKPDPLPPGLLAVEDGKLELQEVKASDIASHYLGVITIVTASVLVALLLPLVLCCCCGGSNKRTSSWARKGLRDERKRSAPCVTPLLLGALTCLTLIFATLALVTNAFLNDGISHLGGTFSEALDDVSLFIDNANQEADTILKTNFEELKYALGNVLKSSSDETENIVRKLIEVFPIELATKVAAGLRIVANDFRSMKTDGNEVYRTSHNIQRGLTKTLENVRTKCEKCQGEKCRLCTEFVGQITIPDVDSFDTVVNVINSCYEGWCKTLDTFKKSEFVDALGVVNETLSNAQAMVSQKLLEVRHLVLDAIDETGTTLREKATVLTEKVDDAAQTIIDVNKAIRDAEENYVEPYKGYRNSAFAVIGALFFVISVISAVGLLVGCCTRNNAYGTLSIVVWLISLLMLTLTVLITLIFLVGLVGERACDVLRKPDDNQVVRLVDQMIQQQADQSVVVHNVSYYIRSCHEDMTMYDVLDLKSTVKIDEILDFAEKFSVDEYVQKINSVINEQIEKIDLLPDNIEKSLELLRNVDLSDIDFDLINTLIRQELEKLNDIKPLVWVEQLKKLAEAIEVNFDDEIDAIQGLSGDVDSLRDSINSFLDVVLKLPKDLTLSQDSGTFNTVLKDILDAKDSAASFIKNTAPEVIQLVNDTAADFKDEVRGYLNSVVNRIQKDSLHCGPLSRVYDSLLVATCDEVISPLNGFWVSAGACLVLFVPTLIFAYILCSRRI